MKKCVLLVLLTWALGSPMQARALPTEYDDVHKDVTCIVNKLFIDGGLPATAEQRKNAIDACINFDSGLVGSSREIYELRTQEPLTPESEEINWMIRNAKIVITGYLPKILSVCEKSITAEACLLRLSPSQ